ncbi:nucleotidyltransferase [Flavobacterium laiguense]|uniref:Nucleotidyltransferase n=1 Tax=Flavobacterium laiguense TaxID=2169409 RepID=A0A2U1K0I4_9FLAO|nr:nucleotidyltransferase [Flavobacterium laiguense]PWA10981.1 nucleotidyltransferase [Flavobacterium laiguense]
MARSIATIKQELTANFMGNAVLQNSYGFADGAVFESEFSKVSIESILFDIFAFGVFLLEVIFDYHKKEIDTAIYEQKSGTPRWYRNMSLAFQYGFDLLDDSDKFENTGFTADQIEASKIIKYCSVKESIESNRLTIKVAGESGDDLIPLDVTQITAFKDYLAEIKYAGVKINVVNNPADKLQLTMAIYRDVLVIDENGNSILNGGKPVEKAIRDYMKNLPFDGELVINDLIAKLRAIDGVNNAHIINATSSAYDSATADYLGFVPINVKTIPVAGYFEIVNFDTVSYVV